MCSTKDNYDGWGLRAAYTTMISLNGRETKRNVTKPNETTSMQWANKRITSELHVRT